MSKRSERRYLKELRDTKLKWIDGYVEDLIERGKSPEEAWNAIVQLAWAGSLAHEEMQTFSAAVVRRKLRSRK